MIELVKHIEILLLENDCVIVPGLGGFIAHNRPAQYCTETNEFCPPLRTIGFNPQLVMNDGLLVQSYMQAYNTDFPDATRKIERIVSQLKEDIYQQGQVELGNIGTLYYNVQGVYEFEPRQDAFFTPSLYGLEKVTLPKLIQQEATAPKTSPRIEIHPQKEETLVVWKQTAWKRILSSDWIQHAISVAAAILLFFILSTPVENTYVDEANYASLGSTSMFDAIRGESIVTTLANYVQTDYASVTEDSLKKARRQSRPKNNVNTLKPVAVKTEKIAAAPRVEKTEKQQAKASGTEIKKDNVPVKASEKKAENTTPKKQVS
ncbi:SPOR domain-containing protein [Phocaeicola barnesiae]